MAAVVPLAPLVDGPPPVPNVLLLIVPTVISSSSTNIVSPAIIPVELSTSISVSDYHQQSVTSGADAKAAAFIELTMDGKNEWGAGIDGNTTKASFQAIVSGLNKLIT